MSYWIYENWTAQKMMKIHHEDCSHCKGGKGKQVNKTDKRNGTWHGPFQTLEEAERAAIKPARERLYCSFCMR